MCSPWMLLEYSERIVMIKKPDWDDLNFDMGCYPAEGGYSVVLKRYG